MSQNKISKKESIEKWELYKLIKMQLKRQKNTMTMKLPNTMKYNSQKIKKS